MHAVGLLGVIEAEVLEQTGGQNGGQTLAMLSPIAYPWKAGAASALP